MNTARAYNRLETRDLHAMVAVDLVSRQEYKQYLRAIGQTLPVALTRPGQPPTAPVCGVSQHDAMAFMAWLSGQDGQVYRLPSTAEMIHLTSSAAVLGSDRWSDVHDEYDMNRTTLCEWTKECQTVPGGPDRPPRILGSIFYPPWLRESGNATQVQAYMHAAKGYSFVGFRLAYTTQ